MAGANLNCTALIQNPQLFAICTSLNPGYLACPGLTYFENNTCNAYESQEQAATGLMGTSANISTGNTAWMLVATAFVMIMTPGVGLFYGGLAGETSVANTILMSFTSMCVVSVQWFFVGYSFAFGPGNNAFGSFDWALLLPITAAPSGAYGFDIPHLIWVGFQCMFAMITPALISGAVIGRMMFSRYVIFIIIWTTVVYDPLAHWVWSLQVGPSGQPEPLGWLNALGAMDFAGGTVIHISSGFAALAAALVIGQRRDYGLPLKPHNQPMTVIGATLLWFGWFGFNAGSAGGAASPNGFDLLQNGLSTTAFTNTHLATCMATLSWMLCEKIFDSAPTAAGAASGAVAGLVAITPACGYMLPWHAVLLGCYVSPFCYGAVKIKNRLRIDDTLDSFAVHGIGGIVGAFSVGLFAVPQVNGYTGAFYGNPVQLGYQMAAIVTAATFSFTLTFVILTVMKYTIGIRVTEEVESEGIDFSEHGGFSYQNSKNEYTKSMNTSETRVEVANSMPGFTGDNPSYSHASEKDSDSNKDKDTKDSV